MPAAAGRQADSNLECEMAEAERSRPVSLSQFQRARLHRLTLRSGWALFLRGERIDMLRIERHALRKEIAIARTRFLIYEEGLEDRAS